MFSLSCFDISPLAGDGVRATNDGERFLLMISGESRGKAGEGSKHLIDRHHFPPYDGQLATPAGTPQGARGKEGQQRKWTWVEIVGLFFRPVATTFLFIFSLEEQLNIEFGCEVVWARLSTNIFEDETGPCYSRQTNDAVI